MKMRNYDSFMRRLDAVERALDARDARALDEITLSAPVVRPDNHFMVEEVAAALMRIDGIEDMLDSPATHASYVKDARDLLTEWPAIKRRARQREANEGRQ